MARTPTAAPAGNGSTAMVSWEETMAKEAEIARSMESSTASSSFFSLRGGILTFNEMPMPNNEMAVVILDSILENVYYDSDFNPENIAAPKCFAYGRDEAVMRPHDVVFEHDQQENDTCDGCPRNEWGSAERGKGKACSNRRRLSVISAGKMSNGQFYANEPAEMTNGAVGMLKLPVTSVKAFSGFIKQVATVMRRPPYGVISLIKVVPDPKTQFKVVASVLEKTPDSWLPIVVQRREESRHALEQPYNLDVEAETRRPAGRSKF